MSYATAQDMLSRFGESELAQITNTDNPTATSYDPIVLDSALGDGAEEIDGYLRSAKYALPLASTPALLTRLNCDIARYILWDQAAPEAVKIRYQDAVKILQGLAAGKVSLGIETAAKSSTLGRPAYEADTPVVGDNLDDF